jgi:hypothetical protein
MQYRETYPRALDRDAVHPAGIDCIDTKRILLGKQASVGTVVEFLVVS